MDEVMHVSRTYVEMDVEGLIDMNGDEIIVSAASSRNQLWGRFRWVSHQTFDRADIVQLFFPGQGIPKPVSMSSHGRLRMGLLPVPPDHHVAAVAGVGAVAVRVVGQLLPQLSFVLLRDTLERSLIGNDRHCPGKEPQQREKDLHCTGQIRGAERETEE